MSVRVERPGMLTTVQDLGRTGYQALGVSTGGAMDPTALRVANLLVGNPEGAAGLEVTLVGPTLVALSPVLMAITGGALGPSVNGVPVPERRAIALSAGDVVAFGCAPAGARAYIAIAGGIEVPAVMGSRATDLGVAIGGLEGRALRRGDVVPTGTPSAAARRTMRRLEAAGRRVAWWGAAPHLRRARLIDPIVRVMRGPEYDWFSGEADRAFWETSWRITDRSNRMGLRLEGGRVALPAARELVSSPVATGTIQVPPGGEPIILMADRQTVGGYPRIAQVCEVDLAVLAQLTPGARFRMTEISLIDAAQLLLARERDIYDLGNGLAIHHL